VQRKEGGKKAASRKRGRESTLLGLEINGGKKKKRKRYRLLRSAKKRTRDDLADRR